MKYGIENYFVPEDEGRDLERPKPGETISIRVVIDKYGNPAIKAVLVNGVERYVENFCRNSARAAFLQAFPNAGGTGVAARRGTFLSVSNGPSCSDLLQLAVTRLVIFRSVTV